MSSQASNSVATWRQLLRNFHLSAQGIDAAVPERALCPTTLAENQKLPELEAHFPLCLQPDGKIAPLRDLVQALPHASIINSAFRIAMGDQTCAALDEIAPAAVASLPELNPTDVSSLKKLLPEGSILIAFHAAAIPLLHAATIVAERKPYRVQFREEVVHAIARLRELLALDQSHAPGAVTAESVTASLGSGIRGFFDSSILAGALRRAANPLKRMEPARRERCQATLRVLEEGLNDFSTHPAFWLFCSTDTLDGIEALGGAARQSADSFTTAIALCESALAGLGQILRALRVARLEMESAYDPAIHDEMLQRFDWQTAEPDELRALPAIIVLESAADVARVSLTSFGRVLRSGSPIQILVTTPGLSQSNLDEFQPDIAYLAISHRESFVLSSSLAEPSHLLPGMARMAKTLRPAVAVVSVPSEEIDDGDPWLETILLVRTRTMPLYSYDPDAGSKWSERFDLAADLQPASELTPVDAAAVCAGLRHHFRLVPADAWDAEQLELAKYLEAYQNRPPRAIPFLWVQKDASGHERAAFTRTLANFCIDRQRAWALFHELTEAGKSQPEPAVSPEAARQEGANDAFQRVLALLSQ